MAETHDLERNDGDELRRRAEEIARERSARVGDAEEPSPEEALRLLHELRGHEIELEMQNEELRRSQQELEASRARYFDLYDLAPVGYVTLDEKGLILETNLTFAGMVAEGRAALLRQPLARFVAPEHQDALYLHRRQLFRTGEPQALEIEMVRRDGATFWARLEQALVRDDDGVSLCRTVIGDIDERKRMEMALRAYERKRLEVTLQAMNDGLIATDAWGRVTLINRRAQELTGRPAQEALGRRLAEVFRLKAGEDDRHQMARLMEEAHHRGLQSRGVLVAADGSERFVALSLAPIPDEAGDCSGMVLVFQDITLQQQMEEELVKASKLESLGVLAGGIAHDFNNLLTGVIGSISLALLEAEPGSEQGELLAEADQAASRARGLAQQLLTFARGGEPLRQRTGLERVLVEAGSFALRGARSAIEFRIAPDLWTVEADAGQMGQVIQNLVTNADQAMPEGGKVTVRAENVIVSEADALPLRPGRYVKIAVADTGVGIEPHLLGRIFDPYFTTKPKGSGIGLAVAYSVVAKHEGHISVSSTPGVGTEFHIWLPAAGEHMALDDTPAAAGVRARGRVLVMDDEAIVTRVARRMLTKLCYRVATARDGAEAVALYRKALESDDPFDVVILDLTVPKGMSGLDALADLKRLDPEVHALVSTGYSMYSASLRLPPYGFSGVLTKPYNLEEMEAAVAPLVRRRER